MCSNKKFLKFEKIFRGQVFKIYFERLKILKRGSNGYFLLKYMSEPTLLYFNLSEKVVCTSTFTRVFLNMSTLVKGVFCHL